MNFWQFLGKKESFWIQGVPKTLKNATLTVTQVRGQREIVTQETVTSGVRYMPYGLKIIPGSHPLFVVAACVRFLSYKIEYVN